MCFMSIFRANFVLALVRCRIRGSYTLLFRTRGSAITWNPRITSSCHYCISGICGKCSIMATNVGSTDRAAHGACVIRELLSQIYHCHCLINSIILLSANAKSDVRWWDSSFCLPGNLNRQREGGYFCKSGTFSTR